MQVKFSELKQKDVINVVDGRNLGRVFDMAFNFPENDVCGFFVPGCKGFHFSKQEIFLPINCVQKIGKDAVLVKFDNGEKPGDRPPQPPKKGANCPPPPQCYPNNPPPNRRSFDEYE
ncbi:MAG: hypothetical protein HDP34_05275 [Clostridia bacterium]|nr:hypothetical protein [Clostridia bacterium]